MIIKSPQLEIPFIINAAFLVSPDQREEWFNLLQELSPRAGGSIHILLKALSMTPPYLRLPLLKEAQRLTIRNPGSPFIDIIFAIESIIHNLTYVPESQINALLDRVERLFKSHKTVFIGPVIEMFLRVPENERDELLEQVNQLSQDNPNIDKAFILNDISFLKKKERERIVRDVFIQIKGKRLTTDELRTIIEIEASKGN